MVFITENGTTRIALPMKHLAYPGDWGSDLGTASLYVNGERAFPKNTNTNDLSLVGMFHEEFWSSGTIAELKELAHLPQLYCTSRPGAVPGTASEYQMAGWGFATKGTAGSAYYKVETGINVCSPHSYVVDLYRNISNQIRYTYSNSSYTQWNHRLNGGIQPNNYYSNRLPTTVGSLYSSKTKCAYNYLFFNRTDQYQYFLARPYALLLFKDWTDANIETYFTSSTGYDDGTSKLRFGMNFLCGDTWEDPLDWDDLYIGVYAFDNTKGFRQNVGYPATYHIVDKYTYDGHTYHIVTASVAAKTVPPSVSQQTHSESCSPYGFISTPVFNVPYSENMIDWSDSPLAVYGYGLKVYVLEFGAEYYVGNWQ